jgi:Flp pilus assembly pilin Flp
VPPPATPRGRFRIESEGLKVRRSETLLSRLHRDERGAVSLETILIIGAIALPILIFLIKIGWPAMRNMFVANSRELEIESDRIKHGSHR